MKGWQKTTKGLLTYLMTLLMTLNLVACGDKALTQEVNSSSTKREKTHLSQKITEVSPPPVIQELREALEVYQPQVAIASPQPDQVLQDDTIKVSFQVKDLPIFVDPKLGMGPHLEVILDNQPYTMVYDISQPLVLSDLTPGTHTLRVFAARPWHESFKNQGAYAQTTFHVFTKTDENNPDPTQPLLTYSRPTGTYGAEPILLDFYLTNAPLHLVAKENPQDGIADWRIRCTINGESFVIDRWEPIYLKGFNPGKNWVKLEFLDDKGNLVKNVFNSTVRAIAYEAKGQDTMSQISTGQLKTADVRGIVEQNYTAKIPDAPSPKEEAPVIEPPSQEEEKNAVERGGNAEERGESMNTLRRNSA